MGIVTVIAMALCLMNFASCANDAGTGATLERRVEQCFENWKNTAPDDLCVEFQGFYEERGAGIISADATTSDVEERVREIKKYCSKIQPDAAFAGEGRQDTQSYCMQCKQVGEELPEPGTEATYTPTMILQDLIHRYCTK